MGWRVSFCTGVKTKCPKQIFYMIIALLCKLSFLYFVNRYDRKTKFCILLTDMMEKKEIKMGKNLKLMSYRETLKQDKKPFLSTN